MNDFLNELDTQEHTDTGLDQLLDEELTPRPVSLEDDDV